LGWTTALQKVQLMAFLLEKLRGSLWGSKLAISKELDRLGPLKDQLERKLARQLPLQTCHLEPLPSFLIAHSRRSQDLVQIPKVSLKHFLYSQAQMESAEVRWEHW
jgi:hypothetical protein